MKSLIYLGLSLVGLFISGAAMASIEGTYTCKNKVGIPNNNYKIENLSLSAGIALPFVEARRFYRRDPSDAGSPILETTIRGLGTLVSGSDGLTTLMIAAVRLEFRDNILLGCEKQQ
jgi:hypothetical protein